MKKKAPGLAKATGIIEIIMGTILIILSITFLMEESSPTGYAMLISGLVFWGFGIAFFRFSRGAWFGNFIMLILAKSSVIYIISEQVKAGNKLIMEDEMYLLFGILALLLMLLAFTLLSKKHLK